MPATKLYDLAVKTGEYTDQSGQQKGRYENVGAVMQGDNGQFIMLKRTFNPAGVPDLSGRGGDSVLISCFEPNNQQGGQRPQQSPQQQGGQGGYSQQHQGYNQPQQNQQYQGQQGGYQQPAPQHNPNEPPF